MVSTMMHQLMVSLLMDDGVARVAGVGDDDTDDAGVGDVTGVDNVNADVDDVDVDGDAVDADEIGDNVDADDVDGVTGVAAGVDDGVAV